MREGCCAGDKYRNLSDMRSHTGCKCGGDVWRDIPYSPKYKMQIFLLIHFHKNYSDLINALKFEDVMCIG